MQPRKRVYALIAKLLNYPTAQLPAQVGQCVDLLAPHDPEIVLLLNKFLTYVDQNPLGKIEDLYTAVFDINPISAPYAGHHIFGDDFHKRSQFMVSLKQFYLAGGFDSGRELPDHLAVVYQFLAQVKDDSLEQTLLGESLIPALEKMVASFEHQENPYGQLLTVVLRWSQNMVQELALEVK